MLDSERIAEQGSCHFGGVDNRSGGKSRFDEGCLKLKHYYRMFLVSIKFHTNILADELQGFWRFLLQKNLTEDWLKGVNYAVFGLGDSSYQKYNVIIIRLIDNLSY